MLSYSKIVQIQWTHVQNAAGGVFQISHNAECKNDGRIESHESEFFDGFNPIECVFGPRIALDYWPSAKRFQEIGQWFVATILDNGLVQTGRIEILCQAEWFGLIRLRWLVDNCSQLVLHQITNRWKWIDGHFVIRDDCFSQVAPACKFVEIIARINAFVQVLHDFGRRGYATGCFTFCDWFRLFDQFLFGHSGCIDGLHRFYGLLCRTCIS